jgi:hypothetical protein
MGFLVTWSVSTRPSTDVEFFKLSEEDRAHIDRTYTQTGLLSNYEETYSEDGMEKTVKWVWYTTQVTEAFMIHRHIVADPVFKEISDRSILHNKEHGIVRSTMYFDVRDDDGNVLDRDHLPEDLWFIHDSLFTIHGHDGKSKHLLK